MEQLTTVWINNREEWQNEIPGNVATTPNGSQSINKTIQ